ncbi:MAG: hypothetical protein A4E65_00642 [Syntrophorhabdus sp. PtaU1.Bin153]|nr:MAG: hypothetical protein A4E65_00642 [Syntrophorhabdus sp. PtaU1.Bin153]
MPNINVYYVLFHTIHDVLRVEKILKQHGLSYELVPVPRNLSSDCGICLKLHNEIGCLWPLLPDIEVARCVLFDGNEYISVQLP